MEVRECWSQTTHWPFQLISQGFLLKFKGGPVSGVSCFVMTYYQYHAHETKGFFLISPCNTHRSCCVSPFGTAVALLLFAGFEKGLWVGIIGAASDCTSLFLEGLLIRIFEIENSCMIYKKFSAGKNLSVRSSQSLLNINKQTALCPNTNSITKTQQKNERARNCTAD